MKTIFTSLRTAAIVLLLSVCALTANAAVTVTQNQNRVASTTFGKGTTNQAILEVKLVADAAETVTNAKFTLTGADQIARVAVYPNSFGNPEFEKVPFASIDNPGANVSFDGSYALPVGTRYFTLVVDFKADATLSTAIDAVCTEVITSADTYTPSATTSTKTITVADNLSGTKTVKNSGGDYATLTEAVAAINALGVGTGGLTIEVADDESFTQTAQGNIIRQTGTATNPIVIKRSGTGTNKPIISITGSTSAFDAFIGGSGVDYVTIDGLDLRALVGTNTKSPFQPLPVEYPIYFYGLYNVGCNNIEVKNCDIDGGDTEAGNFGIKFTSGAKGSVNGSTPNSNLKAHHNTIRDCVRAIDFNYNIALVAQDTNIEVYNNTINGGSYNTFIEGIKLKYCTDANIYNNSIDGTGVTSTATTYGIATDGSTCSGTINCFGNIIKNLSTNNTSNVNAGLSLSATTVNIYNNVISNLTNSNTGGKTLAGIYTYGTAQTYNLYNNTVYLNQQVTGTSIKTYAYQGNNTANGTTQTILMNNNIFVNNSASGTSANNLPVYIKSRDWIAAGSDNNLYYPESNIFVESNYTSLSALITALSTREQASVTGDPMFVDAANNDLTITDALSPASNAGTSVAAVTTDILGKNRLSTKPDIGAYEFGFTEITGGTLSSKGISDTDLENNGLIVTSGELVVDATKTMHGITVNPGAKITINSGVSVNSGKIALESDATGTATLIDENESPTISATVKQYVEAGRNWYISSPLNSVSYDVLNKGTQVVEYNEIEGTWDDVTSGTLTRGKGYIQVASATQGTTGTVEFTGTTNSGDVSVTLSRTAGKGNGFNLVGNPYPSYLDWSMATVANPNVLPTVWFRTKKTVGAGGGYGFATVNAEDPDAPEIVTNNANTDITKYIPPMQAYWVRLVESPLTTTYTVTNAMREHVDATGNSAGNKFKAPRASERSRLRLLLLNGIQSDEALIYFDQAASNTYDRYDSPKMLNNSITLPDIYTKAGSERLVINGLNSVSDYMELPLGFTLKAAATGLKLKVSELSNFAIGTKVYLLDKTQNTQTELTAESEYTFDIDASTTNNESRFSLLFRAPGVTTGVDAAENAKATVYINAANKIVISASEKSNYAIYNVMGQLFTKGTINHSPFTINHSSGVYVVKVNNYTTRVIVK